MSKHLLNSFILTVIIGFTSLVQANDFFTSYHVLSAYDKAIEGSSIFYPTNVYQSKNALLVDGGNNQKISWESEAIPNFYGDQKLKFAFTYSLKNSDEDISTYILTMDSIHQLEFEFIGSHLYSHSDNGIEIEFQKKESNRENSQSGIGFITVPIEYLSPGQSIRFTLEAVSEEANDSWLMIYQSKIKQGITFLDPDIVITKEGENFREFGIEINNFGLSQNVNIKINETNHEFVAENGQHYHPIYLAKNSSPRELEIEILVNDSIVSFERHRLATVKTKNIYLLNESYSVNSIFPNTTTTELNTLRQAIELTKSNPKKDLWSKFHWSSFEFKTIQYYLDQCSPEEEEYLLSCIKNGYIEVSPAYQQIISSLSNSNGYPYLFEKGLKTAAEAKVDKLSQVQIDPSGISANFMEYLLDRGITELGLFQNNRYQIRPEYNKTQKKPVFYQSHYKGKELLVYNQNDTWLYGYNQPSISGHSISKHLYNLKEKSFKYPNSLMRLIPLDGIIDKDICQFVQEWNNTHQSPKLILSNFNKFAQQFRKISGSKLNGARSIDSPFWNEAYLNDQTSFIDATHQFEDIKTNECIGSIQKQYSDRTELTAPLEKYWDQRSSTIQQKSFNTNPEGEKELFEVKTIDSRTTVIYNQLPTKRGGILQISLSTNFKGAKNKEGKTIPFQRIDEDMVLLFLDEIIPYGFEEITFTRTTNKYPNTYPKIKLKYDKNKGIYSLKSTITDQDILQPTADLFSLLLVNGKHPKNNISLEKNRDFITFKDGPLCTVYKIYSELDDINCVKTIYLYHPDNEIRVHVELENLPSTDYSVHMNWPLRIPSNDYKTDCQLFELDKSEFNKKGNLNFFSSQYLCVKNINIQADIYSKYPSFWQIGELAVTPSKYGWRTQIGYNNQFISYLTSNYFGYSKNNQLSYSNDFTLKLSLAEKDNESHFLNKNYPLLALENVYTNRQKALFNWDNKELYIQKMYPHHGGKGIILEIKNKGHEPQKMSIDWNGKKRYKVYDINNADKKVGILRGAQKWQAYQLIRVLLE